MEQPPPSPERKVAVIAPTQDDMFPLSLGTAATPLISDEAKHHGFLNVPGEGDQELSLFDPLKGRPRIESTNSAGVDSQGLRRVSFHQGKDEVEVREFTPMSREEVNGVPRKCCLVALCYELCEVLRDRPRDEPEEVEDEAFDASTADWKHSRTAYDGYLWKLNSDKHEEDMGNVMSWRRRQFYLQRNHDKLALMYTSEKENGVLQVSCLLATAEGAGGHLQENAKEVAVGEVSAKVQLLKVQPCTPMTEEIKNRVVNDLQTYDTAFGQKRFDYDYERDLPTQFHPFLIESTGGDGITHQIVLSGGNQRMSQRWEQAISRALMQMKRSQQRRQDRPGIPGITS